MRILYCIHSLHSSAGMERVLTLKANYLADSLGYEVYVVASHLMGRKPFFELSPKVHLIDLRANDKFILCRKAFERKLNACLKEVSPDICISMAGTEINFLSRCDDGSIKMAEFHFAHSQFFSKYGTRGIKGAYARWRTKRLERAAARLKAFVVLTKEDLQTWRQVGPDNVHQIYNPLTFNSSEVSACSSKRVISVGRLELQKNYPDLIRAWKKVAERHPDWRLDVYGDGHNRKSLQNLINSLGLENAVYLRGRSRDVHGEMLASAFLAMSSIYEGFPMVMLEAAECGLPMVSYDCPCGPSEIIQTGVNGTLVPTGDVDALSEAICAMIESGNLPEMGKRSHEMASHFKMEDIMAQWDRLFKGLIESRSGI